MSEYLVQESTLTSLADAVRTLTGESEQMTIEQMIASIEAGGGGDIFGTSKYEVGSIISIGQPALQVPIPTWLSDVDKVNVIAFTLPTYAWDSTYWTILLKIQREAITIDGYFTNDIVRFASGTTNLYTSANNTKLIISTTNMAYTVYGYEYFYIIWENE